MYCVICSQHQWDLIHGLKMNVAYIGLQTAAEKQMDPRSQGCSLFDAIKQLEVLLLQTDLWHHLTTGLMDTGGELCGGGGHTPRNGGHNFLFGSPFNAAVDYNAAHRNTCYTKHHSHAASHTNNSSNKGYQRGRILDDLLWFLLTKVPTQCGDCWTRLLSVCGILENILCGK